MSDAWAMASAEPPPSGAIVAGAADPPLLRQRRAARVDYSALHDSGLNSAAELDEATESSPAAVTGARRAAHAANMAARRASESVADRAARLATQRRRDSLRGMAATAAAAGGVTLASTHVTADQLRDAEHDPIAAMLLVAESAGSNKWTPRLRALRRATTDEERLIAAQALGVALREEALSPEAAAATVRTFHRQNDGAVSLPACASCGMRAIPSDADDYQRLDLAQLECLRFTRVQEEALLRVPELYRPIHSAYLSVGTGVGDGGTGGTAGGGGDTPSLYFHLHPELVDTGEQAPHEGDEGDPTRVSAILCGRCVGPVAAGNLPPLSLASGHDYGVLRRVVRGDLSPLATRVAVANNRLYLQCIKMKAIGKGSGRVAGGAASSVSSATPDTTRISYSRRGKCGRGDRREASHGVIQFTGSSDRYHHRLLLLIY